MGQLINCCTTEQQVGSVENLPHASHKIVHESEHQLSNGLYTGGMKVRIVEGEEQKFPHGEGVQVFEDGSRYEGSWVDGKAEGEGKFTY